MYRPISVCYICYVSSMNLINDDIYIYIYVIKSDVIYIIIMTSSFDVGFIFLYLDLFSMIYNTHIYICMLFHCCYFGSLVVAACQDQYIDLSAFLKGAIFAEFSNSFK